MKDLGCSSNAARFSALFGAHDQNLKVDLKTVDWPRALQSFRFVVRNVAPGQFWLKRVWQALGVFAKGPAGARDVVLTRCERGADIAAMLGFSDDTAAAIRALDEHWNGQGQPYRHDVRHGRGLLAQLRGQLGYELSRGNEAGVFLAKSLRGADATVLDQTVRLDPISSVNGYFRRAWAATGGETTLWAGVAAGHHNVVWVLPTTHAVRTCSSTARTCTCRSTIGSRFSAPRTS